MRETLVFNGLKQVFFPNLKEKLLQIGKAAVNKNNYRPEESIIWNLLVIFLKSNISFPWCVRNRG